ncbi:MAG: hypothetical protein ACE5FL_04050 [Myxococcota bacterium]
MSPARDRARRFGQWSCVHLAAAVFIGWAIVFIVSSSFVGGDDVRRFCLFDDAMVSMRYAWNLVHGNGLVWNPGERVEGITNLLMTLLMALCILVFGKVGGVLAIQVLGVVFLLVAGFFSMKIGEALLEKNGSDTSGLVRALFFCCSTAYYPLGYWSLMGMETGMLAALLFGAVWLAFRSEASPRVVPMIPILLGLAFLTRPDAAIPAALIVLFRSIGLRGELRWRRIVLIESLVLSCFVVAVCLFRLAYYGSLTPNTYLLKMVGLSLSERIGNGLGFLMPFWGPMVLPLGVALLALIRRFGRHTSLLFALFLSAIGYEIYVGGDPWTYWRKIAPFVPLLLVLVTLELSLFFESRAPGGALSKRTSTRWSASPRFFGQAGLFAAFLLVCLLINDRFIDEITFDEPPYTASINAENTEIGLAPSRVTKKTATVGVTWAGTIPYYAERNGVDFLGKSDKHIASLRPDTEGGVSWDGMTSVPGHNKYDLVYSIVRRRPTYVQEAVWGQQDLSRYVAEHYRLVRIGSVTLRLLAGSPDVLWDRIRAPGSSGERRPRAGS